MNELNKIEKERNIILPDIYKKFFQECVGKRPDSMIGTDLLNDTKELNIWANELLEEDNIESFLAKDDFVFMMHQGYMFWYFEADGEQNPVVYFYKEGNLKPNKEQRLKEFLSKY